MFEAGALIWRIQTIGKNELQQDLAESGRAAATAGAALGETGKKVDDLGNKSNTARPKVRGVRDEIAGMSQAGQQASREVGSTLTAVGVAITGMAVLAVKAAKDWDTAWTGVVKTVDATPVQLAEIESGLRDLTKILPASHTEIAAVAEAAGQLGVKAKDIVAFTRTMVDLGETTNLTADEAATSLAQFMNIMQTAPEDVHRLGSAVVALGNNGASTERDIVQMSQRIAGAGKIIGLTEGETLGLANALASVGIEAEAGGSAVSNIMIDIANAVSQKGDKLLEWSKLAGLSADEFAEKYRTKPAEAISLVIEGLGKLNKSGGDVFATLSDLGQTDVRVTRALLSLANSGDLLRNSLELGNQAWEDDLALQAEATKRYETTAAKLDIARNAVNDMAIDLGQHLLPIVEAGAKGVADFAHFMSGLPDPVQSAAAVLTALAGVVTLVAGAAFLAIPRIVLFRQSVRALSEEMPVATARLKGVASFLTGPWGVAIAAATIGIEVLGNYIDSLQASSEQMTGSLKKSATAADIFAVALKGKDVKFLSDTKDDLSDLNNVLDISARQAANWWERIGNSGNFAAEDALRQVGTNLANIANTDLPSAQKAFRLLADETDGSDRKLWQLISTMPAFRDALIDAATANGTYSESMSEADKKTALITTAMGNAETQTDETTDAYQAAAAQVEALQTNLDDLLDSLDKLNGINRDAITSSIDYQQALADIDAAIQNARDGVDGYALTLDTTTQAGRDNLGMLVDLADKAWDAASAQLAVDGNTQAFQASLQATRDDLILRAQDLGMNADEASRFADQVLRIPPKATVDVMANTGPASAALQTFIDGQSGRTIWLNVATSYAYNSGSVGGIPQGRALGGIDYVEYMATGGIRSNFGAPAQVRRAGEVTVWAEHETGGESYIPWANDHRRPNAVAVLDRTAYELGYDIVPRNARAMAEGGSITTELSIASSTSVPSGPSKTDLSDASIERLTRAFAAQLRLKSKQGGTTNG